MTTKWHVTTHQVVWADSKEDAAWKALKELRTQLLVEMSVMPAGSHISEYVEVGES